MATDLARLRLDMNQVNQIVGKAMGSVDNVIGLVKKNLAGLAAGVSIGAFVLLIEHSIEAADALNKLSQRTGLAVEDLSRLQYAAKLADVSNESLTTGLKKLNVSIAEGLAGDKEKVATFKALGITTADLGKGTKSVMLQMADAYAKATDGAGKQQNAIKLMGRAGDEMIPLLNGGAAAVRQLMDEADRLGITIGGDFAKQAEEFNDNITRLRTGSQAFGIAVGSEVVKALAELVQAMVETKLEADNTHTSIAQMIGEGVRTTVETLAVLFVNIKYVLVAIGVEVGAITAQWSALLRLDFTTWRDTLLSVVKVLNPAAQMAAALTGNWTAFHQIAEMATEDAQKARTQVDKTTASIMGQREEILKTAGEFARMDRANSSKKPIAAANVAAAAEYDRLVKSIKERIAADELELKVGRELTDFEKFNIKIHEEMRTAKVALTAAQVANIEKLIAEAKATDAATTARRNNLEANKAQVKFILEAQTEIDRAWAEDDMERTKVALAIAEQTRALQEQGQMLSLEASLIGATDAQRNIALGTMRIEMDLTRQLEALNANLAFNEEQRELRRQQLRNNAMESRYQLQARTALEEQIKLINRADDEGRTFFRNFLEHGTSAFKDLGKVLKSTIVDVLYELTLRKWVINIATSLTGSLTNGIIGGVGSGIGGSMFGNLAGSVGKELMNGSLFGNVAAGYSGFGGSFASSIGGGLATDAMGATVAEGAAGATLGGGSAIGAAFAAIPVWGWAALGAAAIASFFGSGGGPKVESGYAPNGMTVRTDPAWDSLWANGQRGDPNAAMAVSQGISQSYAALATQLGLLNTKLDVGVFIGKDPQGDSLTQFQVSTSSYDRGARMGGIENVGRSEADLQAAITEETTRVLLEALKASDLDDQYKGWLNEIASTASTSDMQAAIAHVSKAAVERHALEAKLFDLTATDAEKLAKTRDAERAAVDESNRALLEQVYAQQDLMAATGGTTAAIDEQLRSLQDETAKLQVELLRAQGNNPAADAAQRALDVTGLSAAAIAVYDHNNAIRAEIAAVTLAKEAEAEAAAHATAVANERLSLEQRLLELQGDTAALRQRELATLDPTNVALMQSIYALQDLQKAAADAARAEAAEAALKSQALSLQMQIWQLEGNTTAIREAELAVLDESLRPLQERIYALQDEAAAAALAAQAEAAADAERARLAAARDAERARIASEREGLEMRLLELQGNEAEIRRRQLLALSASNRQLQIEIWAMEDQKKAAEELKQTWQGVTDSIYDEVRRIRGLFGASSYQDLQSQFAILTAQARSGDANAAKMLPQISQSLTSQINDNSVTELDAQRMMAQIANSLETTGTFLTDKYLQSAPEQTVTILTQVNNTMTRMQYDANRTSTTLTSMQGTTDAMLTLTRDVRLYLKKLYDEGVGVYNAPNGEGLEVTVA